MRETNSTSTHLNRGKAGSGRVITGRGLAKPSARSIRLNQPVPEGKVRCPECGKCVAPRIDAAGVMRLRGHQAQQYLPCAAAGREIIATTTEEQIP